MSLGLCLAGGGVKGAIHIGILKALEEKKCEINYVSGTSSGSIVAALYAVGYMHNEILELFKRYAKKIKYFDIRNVVQITYKLFKGKLDGFNDGKIIEDIINEAMSKKGIYNIKQVKMPLIIPSIDLKTGTQYCFTSKNVRGNILSNFKYINDINIGKAVRASCSYPVIFSPCKYNNALLTDGGLRENVPLKELKKLGAKNVICVVFEKQIKNNCCNNIIDVVGNSLEILTAEMESYEEIDSDYLIKVKTDENISLLDMSKIDELFELGYKYGKNIVLK